MTEQEVQRLREAGISDEVIMDMMKKPDETKSEGYIDPEAPSETFSQAEGVGRPTSGPETSMSQLGTEALMLLPDAAKVVGLGGAGYYGLKKLGQGLSGRPGPAGAPGPAGPAGPAGAPGVPYSQTPQATFETLRTPESQMNQPRAQTSQSVPRATPTTEPYGRTFTPSRPTNPAIPGSQGMPGAPSAQPAGRMANIGGRAAQSLFAPQSLFAAPYAMAAYEQEKIRQNPTAPEYATTPYAQQYRGEYATQGAAGAANRRDAIAGQQYGGLTQQEQDMLEQDRINRAIRRKAAERVLGPVAPRGM
jgi:hypothetical protein